jgi:hypothetical protein
MVRSPARRRHSTPARVRVPPLRLGQHPSADGAEALQRLDPETPRVLVAPVIASGFNGEPSFSFGTTHRNRSGFVNPARWREAAQSEQRHTAWAHDLRQLAVDMPMFGISIPFSALIGSGYGS